MTRSRHPRFTRARRAFVALYCSILWIAFFSLTGTALGWTSRNPLAVGAIGACADFGGREYGKVAFAYDAFGRRVSKTFDGATTAFIWDGDDLVHERVQGADGAFAPLTTWVFEPGSFTPLAKIEGRKRYGIVGDHLGAPTMLATEAGELAWQAQLDIYGVPREDASGIKPEHKTDNPWRYPGQYEDKETGLYYNRFRYYDPELGRYISEDPIGLEGGLPQYGYVHDPLGWVDPLGLSCRAAVRSDAAPDGLALGKTLTDKQAIARIRRGQDVFVDSLAEAKSLARRALVGRPMRHAPHPGRVFPHFHPNQHANDAHIFFPPG